MSLAMAAIPRPRTGMEALTPREHEALEWAITGASHQQMAREMGIAEGTLKHHLCAILQKLAVQSTGEAVAVYHGLTPYSWRGRRRPPTTSP